MSEGDKVRNYVLMKLDYDDQEKYYTDYWTEIERNTQFKVSNFLRHYLMVKNKKASSINCIYEDFKKFVSSDSQYLDIQTLLKDLLKFFEYYREIITADTGVRCLDSVLQRLNLLEMSVITPYVFNLFDYRHNGQISDEVTANVLNIVEIYLFRRWVCRVPTNSLNKVFLTLHSETIKCTAEGADYLNGVICILSRKEGNGRLPRDGEFLREFEYRDFYQIHNSIKLYLYDRLENSNSRERVDVVNSLKSGAFSVEHIMPRTLSQTWIEDLGNDYQRIYDTWINSLANLTLTGYNSQYSNSRFQDKCHCKNGFFDSGLRINRFIASCEKWTEEELKQRNQQLKQRFLQLWPLPTTEFKLSVDIHEEVSLADEFNFTGRKPAAYSFMGSRFTVTNWSDIVAHVVSMIGEKYPNLLRMLAKDETGTGYYFSENKDHYTNSREVISGVFLEVNNCTQEKMNILRQLFEHIQLDLSELTFELYRLDRDISSK